MNNKMKERVLLSLIFSSFIVIFLYLLQNNFKLEITSKPLFYVFIIIPVIISLLHSFWTLNYFQGIFFFLLSSSIGLIFEIIGVHIGYVFGANYFYKEVPFMILGVPFFVVLFWFVFIYIGYCVVNSFLYWKNKSKPMKIKKDWKRIPLLVLADGFVVVAIDFFMDPLQVAFGNWTWETTGFFFGIPFGNFIGWFIVVIFSTGIFRVIEYYFPTKPKISKIFFVYPVITYIIIAVCFTIVAFLEKEFLLILIGNLIMLPVPIYNLFIYNKFRKKQIN
jgi:putative membrane protein